MIPKSGNGFRKRSCSNNKVERDDDSKKSHPALMPAAPRLATITNVCRFECEASHIADDSATDANALTRPIHDRMPVVLDKTDIGSWLKGEAGTELLEPPPEDRLRMWPVSRLVNKTGSGDDDPTLIDEVAA